MPEEMDVGCARPTGGPVGESVDKKTVSEPVGSKEVKPMIQVGKKKYPILLRQHISKVSLCQLSCRNT